MTTAIKLDKKGKLRLTEEDVTRQACDFMAAAGWRGFRKNVGVATNLATGRQVGFNEPGMPDWEFFDYRTTTQGGWMRGACFHIWIEFKAPGKTPSPKQLAWHEAERSRGALVKVVDHFETFRDWYRGVFS